MRGRERERERDREKGERERDRERPKHSRWHSQARDSIRKINGNVAVSTPRSLATSSSIRTHICRGEQSCFALCRPNLRHKALVRFSKRSLSLFTLLCESFFCEHRRGKCESHTNVGNELMCCGTDCKPSTWYIEYARCRKTSCRGRQEPT